MWKRNQDETSGHTPGFIRAYEYRDYTASLCVFLLAGSLPTLLIRFPRVSSLIPLPAFYLFLFVSAWVVGCLVVGIVAAFTPVHLEISEEGLVYRGLGKKINASWTQVRKVRQDGSRFAGVFTEVGKFRIGGDALKPTDAPPLPFFDPRPTAMRYYEELLEELRQRAPNAQRTIDPVYALFNPETPGVIPEPWLPTLLWMLPCAFVLGTLGVLRLLVR